MIRNGNKRKKDRKEEKKRGRKDMQKEIFEDHSKMRAISHNVTKFPACIDIHYRFLYSHHLVLLLL